jgi:alpha-glucosidase (family GH31 glycosyl hydrolase)
MSSEPLSDRWDKVRNKSKEMELDTGKAPADTRSLYEKLQDQKKLLMEAEMEEQRTRNAVRVLDNDDFEHLESLEASKRAQEQALEQDTKRQIELVKSRNTAALEEKQVLLDVTSNPRRFRSTAASTLRQKDILRSAIIKKRDHRR